MSVNAGLATLLVLFLCQDTVFGKWPDQSASSENRIQYEEILNHIFAVPRIELQQGPQATRWLVTVRRRTDADSSIFQFTLSKTFQGKVSAAMSNLHGESLSSQIDRARKTNTAEDLDALGKAIKCERIIYTEADLATLTSTAIDFEKIQTSALPSEEFYLHAVQYEIWIETYWGNKVQYTISTTGQITKSHPTILKWADRVFKILQSRSLTGG